MKCIKILKILSNFIAFTALSLQTSASANNITAPLIDATSVPSSSLSPLLSNQINYDGRIVGGSATSISNLPFTVSLQFDGTHICGGSILKPHIILTAAHCFQISNDASRYQIRAGSSSHRYGGQLRRVQRIIKHEAFSLNTLDNDVALGILRQYLIYSSNVRSIQLPEKNEYLPPNSMCQVSGWGSTKEDGALPSLLHTVTVPLINQDICVKNYKYFGEISKTMFCARYPQGGKDSCQGDSGGPLVYPVIKPNLSRKAIKTALANVKQFGIVSWGIGCAQQDYPGVYTNVTRLRVWIDAQIQNMSNTNGIKVFARK
ncbi:trypsin-like [Glossina fuscipes]|uniref:Trypsin-like n=1 Tax=Glossina fuscipes TaxID=7396 RepID=A0A9C6DTR2_9MUSC|nr:trypsin-like [Glossina fuscipes]